MPRKSKANSLAEKNESTMKKAPSFKIWVKRHLQNGDNLADYEKAFNTVHGIANEKAPARNESANTDV